MLAARVRYRDLVNSVAAAEHLGGDFGLEVETVGDNSQTFEHAGIEQLVAGFHVGQCRAVEHVGDEREKTVADPVQRHHVLALAGEAAAVHDACLPSQNRLEQAGPIVGIVFEVAILNQDEVAARPGQSGADGCAFALVHLVAQDPYGRVLDGTKHFVGTVARPIIDDNDLEHHGELDGAHTTDDLCHSGALVEDRHDDGQCLVGPWRDLLGHFARGGHIVLWHAWLRHLIVSLALCPRSTELCARCPLAGRSGAPSPTRAAPD